MSKGSFFQRMMFIMSLLLLTLSLGKCQLILVNFLALDILSYEMTSTGWMSRSHAKAISDFLFISSSPDWLKVPARWYCENDYFTRCEQAYRAVFQSASIDRLTAFHFANYLVGQGHEQDAIHLWRQAGSGRYWAYLAQSAPGCMDRETSDGLYLLRRAAKIAPKDGFIQYLLGKRLITCEEWAESVKVLSIALESGDLIEAEYFEALLSRGFANYLAGGDFSRSRSDIMQAAQLQPHNPWPLLRLCMLYRLEGEYEGAVESCNQAVRLAPDLAFAYYYRGRVWAAMEDFGRARDDYRRALKFDPTLTAAELQLEQIKGVK